jgi:hypothetical protein
MAQSPVILLGGATSDLLKGNDDSHFTTSLNDHKILGRGSLQDIDQMAVLQSCVKWKTHVARVRDIPNAVENAFKIAQVNYYYDIYIVLLSFL